MKLKLAAAVLLASVTGAATADLPARMYTKAPVVMAPAWTWTGWYLGAFGGYGCNSSDTDFLDLTGGFGGADLGYNWQAGNFVFGLEVDAAGANISQSATALGVTVEDEIRAFARCAPASASRAQPLLAYVTGGFAWADNRVSLSGGGVTISDSKVHTGWTIGGGLEYMIAPHWSAMGTRKESRR